MQSSGMSLLPGGAQLIACQLPKYFHLWKQQCTKKGRSERGLRGWFDMVLGQGWWPVWGASEQACWDFFKRLPCSPP